MAAPRKPAPPPAARFVQHSLRPAWGVGRVTDVYAGLMRVRFADGVTREFRADVLAPVDESEVPEQMRNEPAAPPAPVRAAPARPARVRKARAK